MSKSLRLMQAICTIAVLCMGQGALVTPASPKSLLQRCGESSNVSDEYILFTAYFNDTAVKNKKMHLEAFAKALQRAKDHVGYIVVYSAEPSENATEAEAEVEWVEKYLSSKLKLDKSRYRITYGGDQMKARTDFYVWPQKAAPPIPFRTSSDPEILCSMNSPAM